MKKKDFLIQKYLTTGLILPFNLATAILRLLIDNHPVALAEYQPLVPQLCVRLLNLYSTWISPSYYMSLVAIVFRC